MKLRFAVLLAGGRGSRLAPLSTPDFPKQFFRLPGEDETLLQQTARAACELVPTDQVIVVTTREYAPLVRRQLHEIDPDLSRHMLVEPQARGTAAAAAVAAQYALRYSERAMLWLLPCDHDRRPPFTLRSLREEGFSASEAGHILTFGVRPSCADTGFGYMLADDGQVDSFSEKPDAAQAQRLIESGRAWWNSGMFVLPARKLLGYLQHLSPEISSASTDAVHRGEASKTGLLLCQHAMNEMPQGSLDVTVMERVAGLRMRPIDGGWSDIGTWPRLLAWWQAHAAHIPEWDFGDNRRLPYADAWRMA
jgi:mannose-1-phosphate guanylyltransferase / mannose-6-phosphate isomerase